MSHGIYVITNRAGIIVAVAPDRAPGTARAGIMPVADHTLHQLTNVDPKILALANPEEFHDVLTRHFNSSTSKLTIDNPEAHVFELLQSDSNKKPFSKFDR